MFIEQTDSVNGNLLLPLHKSCSKAPQCSTIGAHPIHSMMIYGTGSRQLTRGKRRRSRWRSGNTSYCTASLKRNSTNGARKDTRFTALSRLHLHHRDVMSRQSIGIQRRRLCSSAASRKLSNPSQARASRPQASQTRANRGRHLCLLGSPNIDWVVSAVGKRLLITWILVAKSAR